MIRGAGKVLAIFLTLAILGGCHDWNRAPWAPSLPPAFGARVTAGHLKIWTGSRCSHVTRFAIIFEPQNVDLVLTSRSDRGVDVEHVNLGGPYPPGLDVSEPLADDFDWRSERSMRISVYSDSGGWGTSTQLAEVISHSADHPDDTYWFQDVGWLNPADVAVQDGKTFLATCTPDPAKKG